MALTNAELATLGVLDELAYLVKAYATAGHSSIWARTDAANDETYENAVNTAKATAADAAIAALNLGDQAAVQAWLQDLNGYFQGQGYAGLAGWLADRKLRVDLSLFDMFVKVLGPNVVAPANLHGKADAGAAAVGLLLGSFTKAGSLVVGTDMDVTNGAPSPVLLRLGTIGSADWTLTLTADVDDETSKDIQQVVLGSGNGGATGDVYVLGAQAVAVAGAASGQKVVPMAATAQFAAGQTVLLTEWTGNAPDEAWAQQEYGVVASVQDNVSITLEDNLLHSYTDAGYVYPCFRGVSDVAESGGTAGNTVAFYPAADRRLRTL